MNDPYAQFQDAPHSAATQGSDPYAQFADAPGGFVGGDPELSGPPVIATSAAGPGAIDPDSTTTADSSASAPAPVPSARLTQGAGPAPASKMDPADVKTMLDMIQHGSPADAVRSFMNSKGFTDKGGSIDDAVAFVKQHPGYRPGHVDALPDVKADSAVASALNGAADITTLGLKDEAAGTVAGLASLARGDGFSAGYDREVDRDRAYMAADRSEHYWPTMAGELAGGIAMPLSLERAGITTSARAIGAAARDAAIADGVAPLAADRIALRAMTHRMAAEGAAYNGAYGAGSADGGPVDRLTGGAIGAGVGAVGGELLGRAGERFAPTLSRVSDAPAQPLSEPTQVGQAAARQGVSILPQDVGGPGIARATQGAAQTPFGAKTISAAANKLYDSFKGRVGELAGDAPPAVEAGAIVKDRAADAATRATDAAGRISGAVQDALSAPTDSTGAGQLVQRGVSRFMDDTADRASELYGQVPIAADRPAQLGNTRRLLNDLTADWESNPELGSLFRNGRLSSYLDALTPNVTKADTGLLDSSGKPITRDVTQGGNLSWQDLNEFRTRVGDMLANPRLDEKIAPRQLRALYGSLTSDMEATARDAGPDALAKWKRANNFYHGRMKRINNTFSMVLGDRSDATPNEAYAALQSMLKPGSTGNAGAFARIMRSMSPEDANTVRASMVSDARGGRSFDPDAFAKNWGQLSDRGKSALLPQPGMRTMMDDAAGRAALDTKNPFAGLSGEQVFGKLETMAGNKGDAARFAATLNSLSPDEANAVRSTFIDRLGRAAPGAQNAEGDAFSISRWLTRWNTITPEARAALFGKGELRASMQDLATVADRVKASERLAGHSNTGAIGEFNRTNTALFGAVASLLTAHPMVAAGLAAPAAYQRLSAEVLTSPRVLRWLTRVPKQADFNGQLSYLSKLNTIAARESGIASQVLGLRQYLRDAISRPSQIQPAAAQTGDGQSTGKRQELAYAGQ